MTSGGAARVRGKDPLRKGGKASIAIELLIECRDEPAARALDEALMPDNRYFPKDQRFRAWKGGSSIRFSVESPRPRPALSTVAGILSDARLFRDVWVEARARGPPRAAKERPREPPT